MGDIPRLEYHVEECPPPFLAERYLAPIEFD